MNSKTFGNKLNLMRVNSINGKINLSNFMNNYYTKVNEDISKCNKIDIDELKEHCKKLIIESEEYNNHLENWYDSKYYEDLEKFNNNFLSFEKKLKIYRDGNSIISDNIIVYIILDHHIHQ